MLGCVRDANVSHKNAMKIPLLDLRCQYLRMKEEIHQALEDVLESQQFILGSKVEALERAIAEYCGCAHAVGVSSGTDALIVALMSAGIGPGHGVITTPFTFFATAGSIVRVGARPFFVDIDPQSYTMSPEALQGFLDEECRWEADRGRLVHRQSGVTIRALIPVHLFGQCVDMAPLLTGARKYGLLVIEDAAQAIGAHYPFPDEGESKRAGSMGEFGCFSFFPTKNLGAYGDGGMVTTNDAASAEAMRILRVHGAKPKYDHHLVGGNFRLDALQAAVLLAKLKYVDGWSAGRWRNARLYDGLFSRSGIVERGWVTLPRSMWEAGFSKHISSPPADGFNGTRHPHVYNQYVIRARRRDEIRAYLTQEGIGTEIYYPLPLHRQRCFSDLGYRMGDFPESEKAAAQTLALPIYPELAQNQLEYVVDRIVAFYSGRAST